MGAGCSNVANAESPSAKTRDVEGHTLGGDDTLRQKHDARTAAAIAAEERAAKNAAHSDYATKATLLGQIEAVYARRGETVPMGVRSFNVAQLKAHYDRVRAQTN